MTTNSRAAVPGGESISLGGALFGIIDRPRSTLRALGAQPGNRWLLPAILALIGLVCLNIVSAPYAAELATEEVQKQLASLPPEQVQAATTRAAMFTTPWFLGGVGIVAGLLMLFLGWALRAGVLYFIGLVAGGETSYWAVFTLMAWSWVPYIIRDLTQAGYTLATKALIRHPGLAVLATTGDRVKDSASWLYGLLAQVDLFLLWHLLLVGVGMAVLNRFGRTKAFFITLIYLAVALAVSLIPTFIASFTAR
jgi:hypothetical protein